MSASDARTRLLAPSTVRGMALVLCAGGIIGMIVTSIVDQIDAALTFGFVGAVGALSLLLVGILVPAVEAATSLDEKRAGRGGGRDTAPGGRRRQRGRPAGHSADRR
ncbi:MAG: hypothetical protein CM1200mP26_08590 [Acidimicrobiales bacterium]|nr:MAG: hypothetical protein CM1200mP26_08590 [Acidimicrobiales bacterium]